MSLQAISRSNSDADDLGLPENPIYSNYSHRLWKSHIRHGAVQSPNRSQANTDGTQTLTERLSLTTANTK